MRSTTTKNTKETKRIAGEMAKKLLRKRSEGALIIALSGELGTGKTTFVSGFSKALGVNEKILSPTFVLIHKHELSRGKRPNQHKKYKSLYHIDAYRLGSAKELAAIGIKKIFANPENIVMIEWADKVKNLIPKNATWICFKHSGKDKRKIAADRKEMSATPH